MKDLPPTKRIPAVIFSLPVVTLPVMFSVVISLIHFYDSKHVNTVSMMFSSINLFLVILA